jgi:predicted ABC-type ATPase
LTSAELFELFASELALGRRQAPLALMFAGPNGAGKSTAFETLINQLALDEPWDFLNADEVVREFVDARHGPGTPLSALSQVDLKALQQWAQSQMHRERLLRIEARSKKDFVFETVFSDPHGYRLAELDEARKAEVSARPWLPSAAMTSKG